MITALAEEEIQLQRTGFRASALVCRVFEGDPEIVLHYLGGAVVITRIFVRGHRKVRQRRRQCHDQSQDWSEAAIGQGMLGASAISPGSEGQVVVPKSGSQGCKRDLKSKSWGVQGIMGRIRGSRDETREGRGERGSSRRETLDSQMGSEEEVEAKQPSPASC